MKSLRCTLLLWALVLPAIAQDTGASGGNGLSAAQPAPLDVVASLDQQATGIAVSRTGRVFACFPYWTTQHTYSVAEITADHPPAPYPNGVWNNAVAAITDPQNRFVCVQSVYVDGQDNLWILDPASPLFANQVNGAKLVEVDLASNTVKRIYYFNGLIAPPKSYLNDVRIDLTHHDAFISESGLGSIIVLDLNSGKARRVLANSPETKGIPGFSLRVDGQEVRTLDGKLFSINCDGITLDPSDTWVYFEAPTSGRLYRIATADLRDEKLSEDALQPKIQFVSTIGPADGLFTSPDGDIYITSVADHSVKAFDPRPPGPLAIVANDPRLNWPDSLALSQDGWMYVTASQIPRMARFHRDGAQTVLPYQIFRFKL